MSAELEITILGCGSSGGVPRLGDDWGRCDPAEPRNRRRRCALLVRQKGEGGETTVLIDTGPDMRAQLLDAGAGYLDAVIYTHAHADHLHGIDDLRMLALRNRMKVPVYMDEPTSARAHEAFDYCFTTPPGSSYPPILDEQRLAAGEEVVIHGAGGPIAFQPIRVHHGEIDSLAFRFQDVVYLPDVSEIPESEVARFAGLRLFIIDALRRTPHPSHFSLDDALHWIASLKPARAILTNMHNDMDYATLCRELPPHVEPAYDGMVIKLAGGGAAPGSSD
ncbi:MBL fold metallo-hydrolase [Pannonibacter phragmitetus]|uniref:MBL fold metallo-hydrolase n=1 Tax=Pannonibacter phragmitetus TaxID=121719 RepID=UPI000F4573EE|nr:MBL fold metallo-hydrolase [Pannonibacter phragmitetus]MBA4206252.1 phosphoribosyl 1,2-cyclic phosphodiesterase [Polymorphum sp.]